MSDLDDNDIQPRMRPLVRWLRSRGFDTCDSGDGVVNVESGMEGTLDCPHVYCAIDPDTYRLVDLCEVEHAAFIDAGADDGLQVEVSFIMPERVALLCVSFPDPERGQAQLDACNEVLAKLGFDDDGCPSCFVDEEASP